MVKLYEIAVDMKYSFSPFVILAKMCLKHKEIDFESVPLEPSMVRPTIMEITNGQWEQAPTALFDDGDIVYDSLKIVAYLDEKYPNLLIKRQDSELDQLLLEYIKSTISAIRCVCGSFFDNMSDAQKVWFVPYFERRSRLPLDELVRSEPEHVEEYKQALKRLEVQLAEGSFFQGDQPGYYDYRFFASLQMLRCMSQKTFNKLLDANNHPKLYTWFNIILDLHDGFARSFVINPN